MKIISTKVHGVLDYLVGILLMASPWIFNFAHGGRETTVPVVMGLMTIIYSLITNYEYSILAIMPFSSHLVLDTISGIFLALSPWLFGFSDTVFLPHVVVGILELGVVLLTQRTVGVSTHRHAFEK